MLLGSDSRDTARKYAILLTEEVLSRARRFEVSLLNMRNFVDIDESSILLRHHWVERRLAWWSAFDLLGTAVGVVHRWISGHSATVVWHSARTPGLVESSGRCNCSRSLSRNSGQNTRLIWLVEF